MKRVTDKALTICHSQYRTFEMYGVREKLGHTPMHLTPDYEDVKKWADFWKRCNGRAPQVVKCILTVIEQEIPDSQYHWTDDIKENE